MTISKCIKRCDFARDLEVARLRYAVSDARDQLQRGIPIGVEMAASILSAALAAPGTESPDRGGVLPSRDEVGADQGAERHRASAAASRSVTAGPERMPVSGGLVMPGRDPGDLLATNKNRPARMTDHAYPAAALIRYERPIGQVTGYTVECRCGWRSQITTDWIRSLSAHIDREAKKSKGYGT